MTTNGYPHMVFVQPDAGLDKETLAVFLGGLFPDAEVTDKPLRVDLELAGYLFSFWLEEAEGVADRYATYLPEGARRRWLSRCASMIDLHGQPDPERAHAATAARIVAALQDQDGIEVFSEETRRFLGMDYGDGTAAEAAAPEPPAEPAPEPVTWSDSVPAAEDIPAAELAPESVEPVPAPEPVAEPRPEPGFEAVPEMAFEAQSEPVVAAADEVPPAAPLPTYEPAPQAETSVASPYEGIIPQPAPEPASTPEPTTVWMPAAPEPQPHAAYPVEPEPTPAAVTPETIEVPEAATPEPAPQGAAPQGAEEPEKKGLFKRVFGRRNG